MAVYFPPNSPMEATLDSVFTGGAGQFRISIIDTPTGDTIMPPTALGIYEVPAGSGIYSWSGTSPSTTGQYTIYWDDGGDPAEMIATEDMIVSGQPQNLPMSVQGASIGYVSESGTHVVNMKDVGPPSTPQEIKRHRRQVGDMLRRYGQPIIHRHRYTLDDLEKGVAKHCPACFDDAYSQTRNDCPVCYSVGLVSVDDDPERYIDDYGNMTSIETDMHAPLYGGFARPSLTLMMQPDVAIDLFKIGDRGVLTRVEDSKAYTYFQPEFADNDILITVLIAQDGYSIKEILDHYEAKITNNMTIRGWGKRVRDQNMFTIGQEFEMVLVPPNNVLHNVSPGPVSYGLI